MSIHVDNFIDFGSRHNNDDEAEVYARYVLLHFRLNAVCRSAFRHYINQMPLYCTWDNRRWKVIGASRMGDIWLTSKFADERGYETRVVIDECSTWGKEP